MLTEEKKPEIIVFAGPNGSGKSTITKLARIIDPYINADDIKRTTHCSDMDAAIKAEELREAALSEQSDFTFETVLSTERNLNLLKRAREQGYFIRCIYVLTVNPEINEIRVLARESHGGHGVPPEKIRLRRICPEKHFLMKWSGCLKGFRWYLKNALMTTVPLFSWRSNM